MNATVKKVQTCMQKDIQTSIHAWGWFDEEHIHALTRSFAQPDSQLDYVCLKRRHVFGWLAGWLVKANALDLLWTLSEAEQSGGEAREREREGGWDGASGGGHPWFWSVNQEVRRFWMLRFLFCSVFLLVFARLPMSCLASSSSRRCTHS